MPQYQFDLDETHIGKRLDAVLSQLLPLHSRVQIQGWIKDGHVRIAGSNSAPAPSLKLKQPVTLHIDAPEPPALQVQPDASLTLDIVYEDDVMLVVNKPVGLAVHPGAGRHDGTLVNALLAHTNGQLSEGSEAGRPGIVHRLDKDTSGLMLVAKTNQAHYLLAKALQDRTIKRHYLALLWGLPNPLHGTVESFIGRDPQHRQRMAVTSGGKHAVTHYTTKQLFRLSDESLMTLVECRLETGRTHQIRVHMNHIDCPVMADPLYGHPHKIAKRASKLTPELKRLLAAMPGQALHAYSLSLQHPLNGTELHFEAAPPAAFAALLGELQSYA